ncbi:hypothetical protein BJ508DRAFT_21573 [Ascobolus immersus RN42]|uniref:Uncharacterized protein n=1 Tax=Ascobolus immersus RN42 TaxID=1160509 RepID=A0A3N4HSF7_ASCIM|nr:hypothetical protein BJ508DRAFT_21573 [Ascobolus immersus RN42]
MSSVSFVPFRLPDFVLLRFLFCSSGCPGVGLRDRDGCRALVFFHSWPFALRSFLRAFLWTSDMLLSGSHPAGTSPTWPLPVAFDRGLFVLVVPIRIGFFSGRRPRHRADCTIFLFFWLFVSFTFVGVFYVPSFPIIS